MGTPLGNVRDMRDNVVEVVYLCERKLNGMDRFCSDCLPFAYRKIKEMPYREAENNGSFSCSCPLPFVSKDTEFVNIEILRKQGYSVEGFI